MYQCQNHQICLSEAVERAELVCQKKGVRFTELRRKIFELVWATHRPVRAYDLLNQVKTSDETAKPPTVYRALNFLLRYGLIHKINTLRAFVGCSHPLEHSECYFLICSECGEIKECCNAGLAKSLITTALDNKFQTNTMAVEIQGRCTDCN